MNFPWLKAKSIPVPTDTELELVDALEAVTECVEEHSPCQSVAAEGREVLDRVKESLGIATGSQAASPRTAA
jgi:hypothetical protein